MDVRARAVAAAIVAGLLLTACAARSLEPGVTHTGDVHPSEAASASIDAAKQRAAQRHASDVAAGHGHSKTAVPDQGIVDSAEAPFASVDFRATSHWGGKVHGRAYAVYAGAEGQHASVGEVIVEPFGIGSRLTTFHRLSGVGALTVVGEDDRTLVLRDAGGDRHLFDVASGSFQR
jgi:hypothetical protein